MTQAPSIKEALELKPCPFCGGRKVTLSHRWDYGFNRRYPYCDGCFARGPSFNEEEEARAWWNTRATLQPSSERREAIARAIAAYNEVWNGWPELEAKNVDECREEAMKAALLASGLVQDEAGIRDVAIERQRQKAAEGWTAEHDDSHSDNTLASAAAAYVFADQCGVAHTVDGEEYLVEGRELWPWDLDWWKPKDRRRNLVRAAALIIAEIERLDRAAIRSARDGGAET